MHFEKSVFFRIVFDLNKLDWTANVSYTGHKDDRANGIRTIDVYWVLDDQNDSLPLSFCDSKIMLASIIIQISKNVHVFCIFTKIILMVVWPFLFLTSRLYTSISRIPPKKAPPPMLELVPDRGGGFLIAYPFLIGQNFSPAAGSSLLNFLTYKKAPPLCSSMSLIGGGGLSYSIPLS